MTAFDGSPQSSAHAVATPFSILLGAAIGRGHTELSAFDDALHRVGVGDVNLVRLSSVVPPQAQVEVVVDGSVAPAGTTWGDRLYCVYAAQVASSPGEQAWAGIGWMRGDAGPKVGGLFVEHEAADEATVHRLITTSLDDMARRRAQEFAPATRHVIGASCERPGEAVCALVIAAYAASGWHDGELRRTDR